MVMGEVGVQVGPVGLGCIVQRTCLFFFHVLDLVVSVMAFLRLGLNPQCGKFSLGDDLELPRAGVKPLLMVVQCGSYDLLVGVS